MRDDLRRIPVTLVRHLAHDGPSGCVSTPRSSASDAPLTKLTVPGISRSRCPRFSSPTCSPGRCARPRDRPLHLPTGPGGCRLLGVDLGRDEAVGLFRQTPLFAGLAEAAVAQLAAGATLRRVRAGEWLFRQGDAGEHIYVVVSGRLEA